MFNFVILYDTLADNQKQKKTPVNTDKDSSLQGSSKWHAHRDSNPKPPGP